MRAHFLTKSLDCLLFFNLRMFIFFNKVFIIFLTKVFSIEIEMSKSEGIYHECFTKTADVTNKLLLKGENCLFPTPFQTFFSVSVTNFLNFKKSN